MSTAITPIIDSFEASFQDKHVIPYDLELVWLKRAVAWFSLELEPISFDEYEEEIDCDLRDYQIETLAAAMKVFYQQREVSRVNKRVAINTKDVSMTGASTAMSAAKNELENDLNILAHMYWAQKPSAYL